jgi:hypothetical protein
VVPSSSLAGSGGRRNDLADQHAADYQRRRGTGPYWSYADGQIAACLELVFPVSTIWLAKVRTGASSMRVSYAVF